MAKPALRTVLESTANLNSLESCRANLQTGWFRLMNELWKSSVQRGGQHQPISHGKYLCSHQWGEQGNVVVS